MPPILRRLAPQLGAEVVFEPEYGIVGCIRFPNGRQSYFWHNKFNLNSVASARIAQDKGYSNFFLKERGFHIPSSAVFLEEAFRQRLRTGNGPAAARDFAGSLGWDVFLKPLRGSGGRGIVRTCGEAEFDTALPAIFNKERKLLIQQACPGRDYRFVVLDGEVINAYQRVPLTVIGDGGSPITVLLAALQADFTASGRDTIIPVTDDRIAQQLQRNGLTPEFIPPAGMKLRLLDIANLSCGGTTRLVTPSLLPQ